MILEKKKQLKQIEVLIVQSIGSTADYATK